MTCEVGLTSRPIVLLYIAESNGNEQTSEQDASRRALKEPEGQQSGRP